VKRARKSVAWSGIHRNDDGDGDGDDDGKTTAAA